MKIKNIVFASLFITLVTGLVFAERKPKRKISEVERVVAQIDSACSVAEEPVEVSNWVQKDENLRQKECGPAEEEFLATVKQDPTNRDLIAAVDRWKVFVAGEQFVQLSEDFVKKYCGAITEPMRKEFSTGGEKSDFFESVCSREAKKMYGR